MTPDERLRWRLVLGADGEEALGGAHGEWAERDAALGFLYDREYDAGRNVRDGARAGSLDGSALTVPEWINDVHELFPRRTIERIEKDALERYQLDEMVTDPQVLARAQPNVTLLKAVLRTKHLMNQDVLHAARRLVRQVVETLLKQLAREIRAPFTGALDRRRRSSLKIAKNFDARTTIARNLSSYDPERRRLAIRTPHFFSRTRRHAERWQIIVLVDESGSMLDNVIHAAVTAAVFWSLTTVRTHLVLFDTEVVDVTADCTDPVETLMKVQLGGGTDIGRALTYASGLVDNPRRTIVVLITDFFEGGPIDRLYAVARSLIESGVTLLGLAALDADARPTYDERVAARLVRMGAHVGAMTPGELAAWVAEKVR